MTINPFDMVEEEVPQKKLAKIGDITRRVIDELKERQAHPELYRPILTGLIDFDELIGGITQGTYMVVGGKAKAGKTSLVLHLAMALAASERGKTLFYTLEELQNQMGVRTLAKLSTKTDREMIRLLRLREDNFVDLEKMQEQVTELDMYVDDSITEADIIIQNAIEENADFVVVDYLQLMTDTSSKKTDAWEKWDNVSRKFVAARNRTGKTFIVSYQIGKTNTAYGTGSVYRDADLVVEVEAGIDKVTQEKAPSELVLHVLPSRICSEGSCTVSFNGVHGRISNYHSIKLNDLAYGGVISAQQQTYMV